MKILALILALCTIAAAQTIKVPLAQPSGLDYHQSINWQYKRDIQYAKLSAGPKEKIYPPEGETELYYITITKPAFGRMDTITIACTNKNDAAYLYIDSNNNDDLTDDTPVILGDSESQAQFQVSDGCALGHYVHYTIYNTTGQTVSIEALLLRRGTVTLGGKQYAVGLYDYNYNGLYNDSRDVLMIDTEGNDSLSIPGTGVNDAYRLTDVFTLGGKNYKLAAADPDGENLTLTETTEPVTPHYSQWADINYTEEKVAPENQVHYEPLFGEIPGSFWTYYLVDLYGNNIPLKAIEGKYLLLVFYKEGDAQSMGQIQAIARAAEKYQDKMQIIGMLEFDDAQKAKEMINFYHITWPQVQYEGALKDNFGVDQYPEAMLFYPNGISYMVVPSAINMDFFTTYIH